MAAKEKTKYIPYIKPAKEVPNWYDNYSFFLVDSMEALEEVFKDRQPGTYSMAFDTETDGLDPENCVLVGFSFCLDGKTAYYAPVNHYIDNYNLGYEGVKFIYERMVEAQRVIMYNAKFDCRMMEYYGYSPEVHHKLRFNFIEFDMSKVNIFDVSVSCFLADTNEKMPSLKDSALRFLGYRMIRFGEVTEGEENFRFLDPRDCTLYAAGDALCTYLLVPVTIRFYKESLGLVDCRGQIISGKPDPWKVAGKLDNMIIYPLQHFEQERIYLDKDALEKIVADGTARIEELEKQIYDALGFTINLNSPTQVSQAFARLGIDTGVRTESGYMSTGIKVLEGLPPSVIAQYPALRTYIEYKQLFKQISSYGKVLLKEAKEKGYIRCNYKTQGTPTGRLASGKDKKNTFFSPINVQSIPKPHVKMFYVFDLHDREIFDRKRNIIMGYEFVPAVYADKKLVEPDSTEERTYIGVAEGQDDYLNMRATFLPNIEYDDTAEDCVFVNVDYAAQEIRLPANLSHEPVWCDTFISGGDIHRACYSPDTEILTKEGWKTHEHIKKDTLIAQYNPDTDCIEWVEAGEPYYNDTDTLYHFKGEHTDLCVTPNHRMFVATSISEEGDYTWEIKTAEELTEYAQTEYAQYGADCISFCINNTPRLPSGKDCPTLYTDTDVDNAVLETINTKLTFHSDRGEDYQLPTAMYLMLLGYYAASEYVGQAESLAHNIERGIGIEVSCGAMQGNIERFNGELPGYAQLVAVKTAQNTRVYCCTDSALHKRLIADLGNSHIASRHLSGWVKNLPDLQTYVFLSSYLQAAASLPPETTAEGNTRHKLLAVEGAKFFDELQMQFLKIGYSASIVKDTPLYDSLHDTYCCLIVEPCWKEGAPVIRTGGVGQVDYLGYENISIETCLVPVRAFCYTVPTGLLVTRRNGKVSVCGNTAIKIWDESSYNKDYRKKAKIANFGILYGMTAKTFAENPDFGMTLSEAEEFCNKYKSALPTLFSWVDRIQASAKRVGTVYTPFGRPRRVRGYYDARNAAFGDRTAINTMIQGGASDILKFVMLKLWKNLLNRDEYRHDVSFGITVHDEIDFKVRTSRASEIGRIIETTMRFERDDWVVPLDVELSMGWSWGSVFAMEWIVTDKATGQGYYRPKLD